MKTLETVFVVALAAMTSCDTNNGLTRPNLSNQVAGTYNGTLKSSLTQSEIPAAAVVSSVNDYTIMVHCYNTVYDTTFSLELYQDTGNMMRVCLTDKDFKNEYGHDMSANHHMMGGNMGNWTSWQQHMTAEHNPDDEHYGYFDMSTMTFTYTFDLMATSGYTQSFTGKR
jgi:hypothetical protein